MVFIVDVDVLVNICCPFVSFLLFLFYLLARLSCCYVNVILFISPDGLPRPPPCHVQVAVAHIWFLAGITNSIIKRWKHANTDDVLFSFVVYFAEFLQNKVLLFIVELCLIGKRMENAVCFGCACAGRPRLDRRMRKHLMHSHEWIRSSSQRLITSTYYYYFYNSPKWPLNKEKQDIELSFSSIKNS